MDWLYIRRIIFNVFCAPLEEICPVTQCQEHPHPIKYRMENLHQLETKPWAFGLTFEEKPLDYADSRCWKRYMAFDDKELNSWIQLTQILQDSCKFSEPAIAESIIE